MKNISLFDISGRDYRLQRSLLFIFLFSFVVLLQLKAENWLVRGKVLDEKTKEALIGVSILEKNTTNGTVTDFEGNFSLTVNSRNAILNISYIGYVTQQVSVDNNQVLEVLLKEDSEQLDEVVVVGYGAQKKATLSGSVTSVGGEKLARTPVVNLSQGIAGRLPGVVAVSNTSEPGYDGATITIRGVNTFGKSDPLIVVDGVPGRSLERIDPATIETMSVLNAASAAS